MAEYDARFLALAGRLLAPKSRGGKGQEVTLKAPPFAGTFDPETETTTGATPGATHISSGVEDKFSAFSVASGVVAAGDVKFLLSPLKADGSPMPKPVADAWTLTYADGSAWTIKKVDRIAPAGVAVMYELQLRGTGA